MRHGTKFVGQCEACGQLHMWVQLYTDAILTSPIALCIDENARECLLRQESPETKAMRTVLDNGRLGK